MTEYDKIKTINKLLAKDNYNEYKSIMADLHRVFAEIRGSSAEIEDVFSQPLKLLRQEKNVGKSH